MPDDRKIIFREDLKLRGEKKPEKKKPKLTSELLDKIAKKQGVKRVVIK